MTSILIVAAEASSALYAERLMEHWEAKGLSIGQNGKLDAFGIGTRVMEQKGFRILGRSEELAVVGVQEVVANFPLIRRTFHSLVDEAKKRKPQVALLMDYPDFNLRLAKRLKALGIPVVYYISPQIWAWRQSRVHYIKKVVDKMLVLFPFEKDFYDRFQVPVEFVGHPLLDELKDESMERSRFGIQKDEVVLGLMPGSRTSEIRHHLKTQIEVATDLQKKFPKLKVLLLVAPTLEKEVLRKQIQSTELSFALIQDDPMRMISMTDVVLCASGTATLMVGLLKKPMVIMYKMNPLSAFIAKRFIKDTPFFGMINLVLGKEVVKECFQEKASVENLARHLIPLIESHELRNQVASRLAEAKERLGSRGATERVAAVLSAYLA